MMILKVSNDGLVIKTKNYFADFRLQENEMYSLHQPYHT